VALGWALTLRSWSGASQARLFDPWKGGNEASEGTRDELLLILLRAGGERLTGRAWRGACTLAGRFKDRRPKRDPRPARPTQPMTAGSRT
jgi:hypothetical protein